MRPVSGCTKTVSYTHLAKTYRKLYTRNLPKGLELFCGIDDAEGIAKAIRDGIFDARGSGPVFADDNGYRDQEAELLHEYTDGENLIYDNAKAQLPRHSISTGFLHKRIEPSNLHTPNLAIGRYLIPMIFRCV